MLWTNQKISFGFKTVNLQCGGHDYIMFPTVEAGVVTLIDSETATLAEVKIALKTTSRL